MSPPAGQPAPPAAAADRCSRRSAWLRFDRHELAGSFGDIGTDLPLILGVVLATGLDSAGVFIIFGLLQIAAGLAYGLPMPMQPLKAMAVLVITQQLGGGVLLGAGLAIGVLMLLLTVSGALPVLTRLIPRCVVRGTQLGLGLSLAWLAVVRYLPAMGPTGVVLGAAALLIFIVARGRHRTPATLLVIALGLGYALLFRLDSVTLAAGVGLTLPTLHTPSPGDVWAGLLLLALPQLPLSLANSVVATRQTLHDLYPHRHITATRLGATYALANLVAPWFGGLPVCHGCGGIVGHHALGARTGGSVVLYGAMYLLVGLTCGAAATHLVAAFPLPILGAILFIEALALIALTGDAVRGPRREWLIAGSVAAAAFTLPQGYLVGTLAGCAAYYLLPRARPLLGTPASP